MQKNPVMIVKNKLIAALTFTSVFLTAGVAGYVVATNEELRGRLLRGAKDIVDTSKKKMGGMTEDVALRTAQLTKNPKINQDWVESQWENAGV